LLVQQRDAGVVGRGGIQILKVKIAAQFLQDAASPLSTNISLQGFLQRVVIPTEVGIQNRFNVRLSRKYRYHYDIAYNNNLLYILCHVVCATMGYTVKAIGSIEGDDNEQSYIQKHHLRKG
jgi:hypothetical protein